MESQRNLLLLALLFVSFLLYQAWVGEQNPEQNQQAQTVDVIQQTPVVSASDNFSSDVPASAVAATTNEVPSVSTQSRSISLENDKLRLDISLIGGDVMAADLLEHDEEKNSEKPFRLLENSSDFTYIAQSGLIGKNGPDVNKKGRPVYTASNSDSVIAKGQTDVSTSLKFTDEQGNVFTKTFTLKRGEYVVHVTYKIENNSSDALNVQLYGQLKESLTEKQSGSMMMPVYRGGAYSTSDTRYSKYKYGEMEDAALNETTQGGWVAMLQHYFISAWIPAETDTNVLYSNIIQGKYAAIGFKAPAKMIAAHSVGELKAKLWVGPKVQEQMADAAEHLDLTVDYGWLWFIAQPLFKLLLFFQGIVGNWGVAIILITFTVKGGLYPLTKAQYTSMAKMRLLQPKIKELTERCGDDRAKKSKAMMELYKKEKVNPLGGCFPIFLQMPIFIALYWSLMESVELRHAPFMLWIQDLSVRDPYFILPVLMGVSMYFIQKMSPSTVQDPMQQRVMKLMPIIFTGFFVMFPAGLVLYWLMSNIVTLTQQTIIFRNIEKHGLHPKK